MIELIVGMAGAALLAVVFGLLSRRATARRQACDSCAIAGACSMKGAATGAARVGAPPCDPPRAPGRPR